MGILGVIDAQAWTLNSDVFKSQVGFSCLVEVAKIGQA